MANWSAAFNLTPDGADQLADGDNRIRELKDEIREELKVEHDCGTATVDADYLDTGRHKTGSARTFFSAAAPTDLLKHTNAGAWPPVSPGNDEDDIAAAPSSDLDNGRLWVDFDDCQPYIREEEQTGGVWTDLNTNEGANAASWISLWPRQFTTVATATVANQLAGVVDTREIITGMSVAVATPDDGRSYEIVVNAKVHYAFGNGDQMGFWLVEDTGPTDEDEALVHYAGGTGIVGGVDFSFTQTAPVAGTTYTYTVEFAANPIATGTVNPNAANVHYTNGGAAAGDFVGTTSMSRITAELRPRYAAY